MLPLVAIVLCFFIVRLLQRVYWLIFGYPYRRTSDLNGELQALFTKHGAVEERIVLPSEVDGTPLQVRRAGRGAKHVLLLNGVGTDLFMWIPILESCLALHPDLFDEFSFVFPSYRGLFTRDTERDIEVEVTIEMCERDVLQIMRHLHIARYDTIIGWSTGAQLALTCCAHHPDIAQKLFLLNVSLGRTLHTVFQTLLPLPHSIGRMISRFIISLIKNVVPLCRSSLWPVFKALAESFVFRLVLETLSFLGGFPDYQPVYFHQYMFDVFSCRTHTMALLNLIVSLDEKCPEGARSLPHQTVLVSGTEITVSHVHGIN